MRHPPWLKIQSVAMKEGGWLTGVCGCWTHDFDFVMARYPVLATIKLKGVCFGDFACLVKFAWGVRRSAFVIDQEVISHWLQIRGLGRAEHPDVCRVHR